MNPVGHIGITAGVARVLRLNLLVAGACSLLPDVVDKPLALMGVAPGRYAGHTLLFVFLVAAVFGLKNWRYGLAAGLGVLLHLVEDLPGLVPWFWPFMSYDFGGLQSDPLGAITNLSWQRIITDGAGLVILAYLAFEWYRARRLKKKA